MTKRIIIIFFALPVLLVFSCRFQAREDVGSTIAQEFIYNALPQDNGFSREKISVLDSFIQSRIDQGILPNAVVFIARHGKVIHFKSFGHRDLEKNITLQNNDIFRIASQSKAIVTAGLMMLNERGYFLLDDPVSRYIPAFRNPKVLIKYDPKTGKTETRPALREITIHDLLTHTSGIPYDHPLYDSLPKYNSIDPVTTREVVEKIAALPLMHDPGKAFTYGLNTDVAGYLIEVLSGMPLDRYLETHIFKPLGMNDSYFYLPAGKAERLVTLYEKPSREGKLALSSNQVYQNYPVTGAKTYFSGGAGLVGTIEDYAKFCQMLLNGGTYNYHRILGRKTVEQMTINHIGDLDIWGRGTKFGLGLEIQTEKGLNSLPGSAGSFKWGGMYATDFIVDPKEGLVALLYTNVQPFAHWEEIDKFRVLLYQSIE